MTSPIQLGPANVSPEIRDGYLHSLGSVTINGVSIRNPDTRFLPWFDTFEGDVFGRFRWGGVEQRGATTVLRTTALSDPDTMFRERRDSSGDLCFREASWDAPALESQLNICFEPVTEEIDGRAFRGFKYWFEYRSDHTAIHRLVDRQTWEIGGNLDDMTLVLRNWLTPPRMRIGRDTVYSTVGLDQWAGLLPGNLWGRWSLLPSFDMQYGKSGVMLGWFDRVSLIRTVIETAAGEDCLRCRDMHLFTLDKTVTTNPKTILHCPDRLDETDALNLWTRVQDRENDRARRQFGMPEEEPPAIVFAQNQWRDFKFATSYENVIATTAEFGGDMIFIDPVWEHQEAMQQELAALIPKEKLKGSALEKLQLINMCVTHDYSVAAVMGGEEGLKALVDRAKAKGIRMVSWMSAHYSPLTTLANDPALRHGKSDANLFAARESGRHPDTGYPSACWSINLNGPIYQKLREQILGVCRRTGLAGFLWDSYCNLGWWSIDYPNGDMRPQFDKMAQLHADLMNAGLYIMPEAVVTFSSHSCCGLHGGNVYAGDLIGYSYNTNISLHFSVKDAEGKDLGNDGADRVLQGQEPFLVLFECFAHRRVPSFSFHNLPREKWNAERIEMIRELFRVYRKYRHLMKRRTVLKEGAGVLWENGTPERLLFAFKDHPRNEAMIDAGTGERVTDGRARADRVYVLR